MTQSYMSKLTLIDMLCSTICNLIFSIAFIIFLARVWPNTWNAAAFGWIALISYLLINLEPILIKSYKYNKPELWARSKWNNNVFYVYTNITQPRYRKLIAKAVHAWNTCSHIQMYTTSDINKAQIRIYGECQEGTQWTAQTVNNNYKYSLPITLNYYYLDVYSNQMVLSIIEHELGHSIGLGHSLGRASVMYPFTQEQGITNLDRATIDKLY